MTESEFEKIYRKNFDAVHKYLLKLCRNARTADEITSDTFFKAMNAIGGFEGKCDIRSWLCGIAKNSYFSYLKKTNRTVSLESVPERSDDGAELEERLSDAEAVRKIMTALDLLKEPYKEVFNLRVFGEMSFKQIAELYGKTENWACVTYHRAKSKIQAYTEEIK